MEEVKEKLQSITTNGSNLYDILKSESVFWALRYCDKNPSKSGMDNCDDDMYLDLYNFIKNI
jgi:hypothetical protein